MSSVRGRRRRGRSANEIFKSGTIAGLSFGYQGPLVEVGQGGHRAERRQSRSSGGIIGQSQNPRESGIIRFLFRPTALYRIEQEHFSAKQSRDLRRIIATSSGLDARTPMG